MLNPALMPFKTNLPRHMPMPALSGFSLLGIEGVDAESFLQAQLMNDVKTLAVMDWQWTGWLNPKGRVIALFALARIDSNGFMAISADFPASELASMLQRYVFRAKVRLRALDELVCAGTISAQAPAHGSPVAMAGSAAVGFELDFSGSDCARRLWLLPVEHPLLAPPQADLDADWLRQDLLHGLPRLPASQRELWTPQMLSLDRLHAYSLKKGCYPGQEIVARTHYLGQSKRALVLLQGVGLTAGASVDDASGSPTGSVVSASANGELALAVCSRDSNTSQLQVAQQPVLLLPLLPGLDRLPVTGITPASSQKPETGA